MKTIGRSPLNSLLAARKTELRSPDTVMVPEQLGAHRLIRYCFSRTMLRRATSAGWTVAAPHLNLDPAGQGEVVIRVDAEGYTFHFVAFLKPSRRRRTYGSRRGRSMGDHCRNR
jgi:hypothetical protein